MGIAGGGGCPPPNLGWAQLGGGGGAPLPYGMGIAGGGWCISEGTLQVVDIQALRSGMVRCAGR